MKPTRYELMVIEGVAALVGLAGGAYLTFPGSNWWSFILHSAILFAGTSILVLALSFPKTGPDIPDKAILLASFLIVFVVLVLVAHTMIVLESILWVIAFSASFGGMTWQWVPLVLVNLAFGIGFLELWQSPRAPWTPLVIVIVTAMLVAVPTWLFLIPGFATRPAETERIASAIVALVVFAWMYSSFWRERYRIVRSYRSAREGR